MQDYELRPSRNNLDIRRQMDAQAQVVGKWEDAHRVPDQKRLTWFYPDFGSYVVKEYITPEQLASFARGVERQEAARAHKVKSKLLFSEIARSPSKISPPFFPRRNRISATARLNSGCSMCSANMPGGGRPESSLW